MRITAGLLVLIFAAACGDGTSPTPPGPPPRPAPELACGTLSTVTLTPGESVVLSAAETNDCVRVPAGDAPREYLAIAYSATSETDPSGISGPYRWRTRAASPAPAPRPAVAASQRDDGAARFHAMLRERERLLGGRPHAKPGARVLAPALGERRSFGVCGDLSCSTFVSVPATAAYVGRRLTLFLEDPLPPGGFEAADYERLGKLFDDRLYPIDTTAFGRESDVDGNGVVFALISAQVNRLCLDAGGVIAGYFYGLDLRPSEPGSNGAEVFYAAAPDPTGAAGCRITRDFVERILPGTFAHEFQHMISYNQHVLIRGGQVERTWLNEGLSQAAEELAGRRVPNADCLGNDCLSQFAFTDVSDAYQYLLDPERWFVVMPANSTGRSAERGAAWLFVRWVSDHFGGTDAFTRSLVATDRVGAANVEAVTAVPFDRLLGEWHLANYLDDLPGFTPANPRLRYTSWNWRVTFPGLRAQFPAQYPRTFPLVPDSTAAGFDRDGILRGGSGRYLRIQLGALAEPVDLRLTDPSGGPVSATLGARIAVARIR